MNNGDLPAAPILGDTEAFVLFLDKIKGGNNYGLTKRETFAMAAMQGMMANSQSNKMELEAVAGVALMHADALLKALEGQQLSTQEDNDLLESATGCSMEGLDKLTVRGDS